MAPHDMGNDGSIMARDCRRHMYPQYSSPVSLNLTLLICSLVICVQGIQIPPAGSWPPFSLPRVRTRLLPSLGGVRLASRPQTVDLLHPKRCFAWYLAKSVKSRYMSWQSSKASPPTIPSGRRDSACSLASSAMLSDLFIFCQRTTAALGRDTAAQSPTDLRI